MASFSRNQDSIMYNTPYLNVYLFMSLVATFNTHSANSVPVIHAPHNQVFVRKQLLRWDHVRKRLGHCDPVRS